MKKIALLAFSLLFTQSMNSYFTFAGFGSKIIDGATALSLPSKLNLFNVEDFTQHNTINPLEDSYWNYVDLKDTVVFQMVNQRCSMQFGGTLSLIAGAVCTIGGIAGMKNAKDRKELIKGGLTSAGGVALLALSAYLFKTCPKWEDMTNLSDPYLVVLPR